MESFTKSTHQRKALAAAAVTLFATLSIMEESNSFLGQYTNQIRRASKMAGRGLSVFLGGDGINNCKWTKPIATVPVEIDLWKTLLVGFPSGDKRMVSLQMEALSGLPSKEDWDFIYTGYSNEPFIKTNYPHPSGIWSWDKEADQVALVVQFIRHSMVEYSDIVGYMSNGFDYSEDRFKLAKLHTQPTAENDINEYLIRRDRNVLQEIFKYSWYIDYWMENGLLRDPYSHDPINQEEFKFYASPEPISSEEDRVTICHRTSSKKNPLIELEVSANALRAHANRGDFIGTCESAAEDSLFMSLRKKNTASKDETTVQDPNCDKITGSCRPVTIISADKLRDDDEGTFETEIISKVLMNNEKMAKWVINEKANPCIWNKVINNEATFDDQHTADGPNFSQFILELMEEEIQRLVDKYSSDSWTKVPSAKRLVGLLREHISLLQSEIEDVASGKRFLSEKDVFGPGERQARFGKITG